MLNTTRSIINEGMNFEYMMLLLISTLEMQAQYFCSSDFSRPEFRHYGLAMDLYTHFTSPIRRYADICVHRLLAAAEGLEQLQTSAMDRKFMQSVVANLNERHRNARLAGSDSATLFTLLFFRCRLHFRENATSIYDCAQLPNF